MTSVDAEKPGLKVHCSDDLDELPKYNKTLSVICAALVLVFGVTFFIIWLYVNMVYKESQGAAGAWATSAIFISSVPALLAVKWPKTLSMVFTWACICAGQLFGVFIMYIILLALKVGEKSAELMPFYIACCLLTGFVSLLSIAQVIIVRKPAMWIFKHYDCCGRRKNCERL